MTTEEIAKAHPQWTTEPPTEPGWYWGVPQKCESCKVEMVHIVEDDGVLELEGNIYNQPLSDAVGWYWTRIVPPEPPK